MTISLSLLGGAGWQFLNNSGNVLSGGLLYTYAAGTTTPLTTYTSSTGLTANSNPIVLDSAGRVPYQIWLTDGSAYKFVLQTSAAVQIGAWDNVYAPGVNSISFGTTGLTPATATQGAVTVAGTLNVANGGTGLTSLTAGRIPFGNGTAAFDNSTNLTYTTGTNTFSAPIISAATSMANAGNMLFSGTAARIQGDFSNATVANRTSFQDKTANTITQVNSLPNGTAVGSGFVSYANSDPTNSAYVSTYCDALSARLSSSTAGSGTALPLAFYVPGIGEAGRFDTAGIFYVGATSFYSGGLNAKSLFSSSLKALTAVTTDSTGTGYTAIAAARQNSDGSAIELWRGSSVVGQIQVSASGATYGTISDYRLKSNPQTLTGSGAFIDALLPKTWTWTVNGLPGSGFIAHEAAQVAPRSVSGQKDAVNDDGTPNYQGMDYGSSEIVANIVAELKSLRARVAVLEARP